MQNASSKSSSPQPSARHTEVRAKALEDLQRYQVFMVDGHFDYGNGYHGQVYLNPHQLFKEPSLIWRLAQDLIDLLPGSLVEQTDVVAGPVTGGALPCSHDRRVVGWSPQPFARPVSVCAVYRRPVGRPRAAGNLRRDRLGKTGTARRRRTEHRHDAAAMRRADRGSRRQRAWVSADPRQVGVNRGSRCPERRTRRVQGAA